MPINDEGVEVNEDGSPVTPEQMETANWAPVQELHNKTKLKPYSMEEMATTSVPHNIPYLEIYRSDELYYQEYKSSFLSNEGNTTLETPSDEELSKEKTDEEKTPTDPKYTTKDKNSKLNNELKGMIVSKFKNTANYDTLVSRYMDCNNDKKCIDAVTERSKKHLKDGVHVSDVGDPILKIKEKYS